ncbi:hypothetical protein M5K25_002252 [Dendrobium thyrsiflorum]|uniref:Uncharacterized protein n=1 Tax=Dendrobium thyrsiflorum TaxID=117978 RepID=A0ABD0VSH9_DENTH
MADPERDFGIAYDDQGLIQILQSPFFDIDPEVDHTVNDYIDRILETVVLAVEEQLGAVEWRLAADPNFSLETLPVGLQQWRVASTRVMDGFSLVAQVLVRDNHLILKASASSIQMQKHVEALALKSAQISIKNSPSSPRLHLLPEPLSPPFPLADASSLLPLLPRISSSHPTAAPSTILTI